MRIYRFSIACMLLIAQFTYSEVAVIDSGQVDVDSLVMSPEGRLGVAPKSELASVQDSLDGEAAQLKTLGYIDKKGQTSKVSQYVDQVKNVLTRAEGHAYELVELQEAVEKQHPQGQVVRLSKGKATDEGTEDAPFGPVGSQYKNEDNTGYLLITGGRIAQLHDSTKFGTLLVEEFVTNNPGAIDAWIIDPNIEIMGRPGKVTHVKYSGGEWGTILFAPHDRRVVLMECDTKLDAEDQREFIQLAEELIVLGPSIR